MAQVTKCIFCEAELTPDTKPEHILLSSLGGRKTSQRIDCSKHNGDFGSTIDKEVGEQVRIIRHLLQLESGTRKPAPGLKGIKAGKVVIDFDGDGTPRRRTKEKPFTVTKKPDGTADIEIRVTDIEQLKKLFPNIARAANMTEQQLLDSMKKGSATLQSERPGTVHHQLSFGGETALRSPVKSALGLWALAVGNDEVRSPSYADARDFVLNGGDFNVRKAHLDSRPIPDTDALVKRFGNFFNLLYVASNSEGRVVGHFTLYNTIGWQFLLAEKGGSPNLHTGLINNPMNPGEWSDAIADEFPIPFDWLNNPTYVDNFERARERVASMMQQHVDTSRSAEWDKIIKDAFTRNGVAEGQRTTDPAVIKKISSDIAQRIAAHALNLPYSEALKPEDIARMLEDK